MKLRILMIVLLALGFSAQISVAQNGTPAEMDVQVFESVLTTAGWANFKYMDQLALAKKGDHRATLKLLEFSGTVDGRAALDHSVTLLELIQSGGDLPFAAAVNMAKPKLKSILLERLQLAQARTQKAELRKPISEWAPMTWDVLQGKTFMPKIKPGEEKTCLDSNTHGEKTQASGSNEFGAPASTPGAKSANTGAETPKGKQ